MCIAILNTKGIIRKKTLRNCWDNNPDGAGLAYPLNGKVKISKEMKSFNGFYKQYLTVRQSMPENNILIHFRISTHGKINETNCHPFLVNKQLAFIHNGMIYSNAIPTHQDFSDTYLFNQIILKKLPANFIYNEATLELLASYIGFSKVIFLTGKGEWMILNEDDGYWIGDNWFSNTSYTRARSVIKFPLVNKVDTYKSCGFDYWSEDDRNFDMDKTVCNWCNAVEHTKYIAEYNQHICNDCLKKDVYMSAKLSKKELVCDSCLTPGKTEFNNQYNLNLCEDCQMSVADMPDIEPGYSF